jgi:hypothetical protein
LRQARPSAKNDERRGTPDYNACMQNLDAKLKDLATLETDTGSNVDHIEKKQEGNVVSIMTYFKTGVVTTRLYRLTCLPDTIDPRGPKLKS